MVAVAVASNDSDSVAEVRSFASLLGTCYCYCCYYLLLTNESDSVAEVRSFAKSSVGELPTTYYLVLTTYYSLTTAHYSQLTKYYLLLITTF